MTRLILLAGAAAVLAGCGLKGDLETPAPLWGDPNRAPIERDLARRESPDEDDIVFTRDDIDLFGDDPEDEDPFAERDAREEAEGD